MVNPKGDMTMADKSDNLVRKAGEGVGSILGFVVGLGAGAVRGAVELAKNGDTKEAGKKMGADDR